MKKIHTLIVTLAIGSLLVSLPLMAEQSRETLPPSNPYLIQNSIYPSIHFDSAQTDTTALPSWKESMTIKPSQVYWLPGGTTVGTAHRVYPDGKEAIFFSGANRVGKIRISDSGIYMVDEVIIPGYEDKTISTLEIRNVVKTMQKEGKNETKYLEAFSKFLKKTGQSSATLGNGAYTLMDKDGYYYAGWGTSVYKIGDVDKDDIGSPIQIVKAYDIRDGVPKDQRDKISRIFGFAMTYDGHLAIAMPGIIAVMDRDFKNMQYILLEDEAVDNGISVDDKGGIYCVTSKYMRKVVWDGKKLSDKESDGAWKSEYDYVPNTKAMSRGSGNTPTLMGFGPNDDKLVVIADAGKKIKVVAFWRDQIPEDFKQKPKTKSRRIADQLALKIDVPATIEWSAHVYGNGVMMMASAFPDGIQEKSGKLAVFETVMTSGVTREAPKGAEKWSWDSKTKSFKSNWIVNYPLQWSLYPISSTSNTVTLTVLEKGVYSLVNVDWNSGKEISKIVLGDAPFFNAAGGFIMPINENSIYITGVFGPVLITKK